jgi:hypothetical protein
MITKTTDINNLREERFILSQGFRVSPWLLGSMSLGRIPWPWEHVAVRKQRGEQEGAKNNITLRTQPQ